MYLRAGLPADTYIKRPPGVIYPFWDQVNESGAGDLSRYMGPTPRSSRAMSAWASSHGQQCQPVQRNILRWRSLERPNRGCVDPGGTLAN